MSFFIKVVRNAAILTGILFLAIWGTTDVIGFNVMKTLIIFGGGYILAELSHHYKIQTPRNNRLNSTLCF